MQEYLLRFMPTLTDGLTEMSLKRPKDPQAYLAAYILAQSSHPDREALCANLMEQAGVEEGGAVGGIAGRKGQPEPLRIIIAGAPCSGKGTQCELIKAKFDVVHLSTGDLLRAEVAARSPLGQQAEKYMASGRLIPDDLIISMVKERVTTDPEIARRGWMLDGFPRTEVQARALEEAGLHPDIFLLLDVPDEVVISRVTGRRTDPATGVSYHVVHDPPPAGEIAARCVQRADDTEAKIATRLHAFHEAIHSISEQYAPIKVEFDGNVPKAQLSKQILVALADVAKRKGH